MAKSILDNLIDTKTIDTYGIYDSYKNFSRQLEFGWHEASFVNIGFTPASIQNIIVAGMGGSNIPAKIIQSLAPLILHIPFEISANYRLPSYTSKNSLVILISYSGNTEETISCAQDAKMRGANVVVITTGGKLKDIAITEHWPLIHLDEKLNTTKVPRGGLGMLVGALLGLIVRINPESYRHLDQKEIIRTIDRSFDGVNINIQASDNYAKTLATKHRHTGIVIFAANHLLGVAQAASNYINESAKTFCTVYPLPDLNHHLLEGLAFPTTLKDDVKFILLDSAHYPVVIQKRLRITKDVLIKQKYQVTVLKPESNDAIAQSFESLVFLIMFSYYLSIVNKVDPGTNPWVDYFKNHLL